MLRFQLTVLLAFFLYFLSFLTGRPGYDPVDPELFDTFPTLEESRTQNPVGESEFNDPLQISGSRKSAVEPRLTWRPGLIQRVIIQRKALTVFLDRLLESDSRPDQLLRTMERSLTGDTFLLTLDVFWCLSLIFCSIALVKRHWFYNSFVYFVLSPSVVLILLILTTVRRENLILTPYSNYFLPEIGVETALMLAGIAVILQRMLPQPHKAVMTETNFMGHLRTDRDSALSTTQKALTMMYQIVLIVLVGLILSNILLLPMYILQISFPGFFAALFAAGLFILAIFYTRAYLHVAGSQHLKVSIFSGISFLGYRIIKNSLFIGSMAALVISVLVFIAYLAGVNVLFLQNLSILKKPGTL